MGAHQRLDRRRVDPGEGGLRKGARRSESVLTLLTFPRFYLGNYPRGESNSHLRFRKPLFYPLNYGDRVNGKGKKEEERSPEIRNRKDEGKSRCQIANCGMRIWPISI